MLCGADEIGLNDDEDGLMILPADSEIGKPLTELYPSDTILEIEITPNRPDLLSHYGMARELAALLAVTKGADFQKPLPETVNLETSADSSVQLESETCPYYSLTRISGTQVTCSPAWLKDRLESIGLRPINNVVDVTNFVLHELGHPLHAFDAAKVQEPLVVRKAADGEMFRALDEEEYTLTADDTVISDASGKVLALAGVMGGLDSGVTESTQNVLLESAYFTPSEIRKTSRRLNLSSDSSYRFERGSDPVSVVASARRATELICELAGGKTTAPTEIAGVIPILTQPVALDPVRLDQLMAGNISLEQAEKILSALGLEKATGTLFNIPSYRQDLQRHVDLVEEIARVHGLDNVESEFSGTYVEPSQIDSSYDVQLDLKKSLAALGFFEAQTIKLISEAQLEDCLPIRPLQDGDAIKVSLPLSEDHTTLRPSLTAGLVAVAARNVAQGASSLRFFELGRTFRNMNGGKAKDLESDTLALLVGGQAHPQTWVEKGRNLSAFDVKGMISALLPQAEIQFLPRERDGFLLASDVTANGKSIGSFAQLLPRRARGFKFNAPIYLVELDCKALQKLIKPALKVENLPQFPGSTRDASIEAPAALSNAEIEKVLSKHKEPLLVSALCTDIFTDPTGEKLSTDKKALTYSFHYRSNDGTLKQGEVDELHAKLLKHLDDKLPITFR